jgi:hypothetical protein
MASFNKYALPLRTISGLDGTKASRLQGDGDLQLSARSEGWH